MTSTPLITCDHLHHVYARGNVTALNKVNVAIHQQEIIGIIGQNGSGKTTLVKHFNGLLKPTSGRVLLDGQDTVKRHVQELAAYVGYVFQNPNHQLFAKTVEEELEFGPRNMGLSDEQVIERREKAIEFFGLQQYRSHHPYRISFPLRKLVGMASVYTMQPRVFILDEPTTGQDNITTRTVYRLIHRLRDEGKTVICVSHDMILLAEVVDRMIVMRNAQIIADATPREVFADSAVMQSTRITPPQVTEFGVQYTQHRTRPLADVGPARTVVLSVQEAIDALFIGPKG